MTDDVSISIDYARVDIKDVVFGPQIGKGEFSTVFGMS